MDKLDIDALYDEAEKAGRFGECMECEEEHVLCFCGVCFKYCHDDYMHAETPDLFDEALRGLPVSDDPTDYISPEACRVNNI